MLSNEERELQIELTKLQIEHEHRISKQTIFLSVLISLIVTTLSVYLPIGVMLNNLLIFLLAPTINSFLVIFAAKILIDIDQAEKRLASEIQELKKKYLW